MEDKYDSGTEFGADDVVVEDDLQEEGDEIVPDEQPAPDDDTEPASEEDGESDKSQPKKRDKAQTRINQLQREKYRALSYAEKNASEAEYWKQRYELSSQAGVRQHDANIQHRLDKARATQLAAIESGDAQAQVDANIEIAAATAEMQELNSWKYRDQIERDTRPQQSQSLPTPDPEITNEWVRENSEWINPQSQAYDEELAQYIVNVDNQLANALRQRGADLLIGTSDYFNELDNHREQFLKYRNNNRKGELNMNQSRGGASPVRGNASMQSRSGRQEYRLSPQEREMARAAARVSGCKEDIYVKEKIRFMKEQAAERGGR